MRRRVDAWTGATVLLWGSIVAASSGSGRKSWSLQITLEGKRRLPISSPIRLPPDKHAGTSRDMHSYEFARYFPCCEGLRIGPCLAFGHSSALTHLSFKCPIQPFHSNL